MDQPADATTRPARRRRWRRRLALALAALAAAGHRWIARAIEPWLRAHGW